MPQASSVNWISSVSLKTSRTVAIDIPSVLADVAAQLLTLLGREAVLPRLPIFRALLLAALQFLFPLEIALTLEFALLRPLETPRLTACRLCMGRQARCHRHENASD